jgi:hypothetical protein
MKRGSILFLKAVLVLVAAGVLAFLIWEPQAESVNANADLVSIYFLDPFVAYAYVGSLPFFFGVYQAFKLLGYVGQGQAFTPAAVKALRRIRYCALIVMGFIAGGEAYIILGVQGEDSAGAVAMGIIVSFICVVTATAAAMFERVVQSAVDLKLENDLTV